MNPANPRHCTVLSVLVPWQAVVPHSACPTMEVSQHDCSWLLR